MASAATKNSNWILTIGPAGTLTENGAEDGESGSLTVCVLAPTFMRSNSLSVSPGHANETLLIVTLLPLLLLKSQVTFLGRTALLLKLRLAHTFCVAVGVFVGGCVDVGVFIGGGVAVAVNVSVNVGVGVFVGAGVRVDVGVEPGGGVEAEV